MEKLSGVMGKTPRSISTIEGIFYSEANKGTCVCHDHYNLCFIV